MKSAYETYKETEELSRQAYYESCIVLMQDELREELHRDNAGTTDAQYIELYCREHLERFGEIFQN